MLLPGGEVHATGGAEGSPLGAPAGGAARQSHVATRVRRGGGLRVGSGQGRRGACQGEGPRVQKWLCDEKVGDLGARGMQGQGVGESVQVDGGPTREE